MLLAERIFAGFLLLISIVGIVGSLDLPLSAEGGVPGPGLLPLFLSITLAVLSLIYFIQLVKNSGGKSKPFVNREIFKKQNWLLLFVIIAALLVEVLGMFVTLGLFTLVVLYRIENIPWKRSVILGIATAVVMYVSFEQWLGLVLPKGIFG
jgi:putative tricarboxylic transport membrane protein